MYNIGDRVHDRDYVKGCGNGTITDIYPVRNLSGGFTYTGYEVEYDEPVRGPWPRYQLIRRAVCAADRLELLGRRKTPAAP